MGTYHQWVLAGMPMPELTEIAKLRLDAISFFLLLVVLGTLAIQWGWNRMASDFNWMPRLNIRQSFGVTIVWGLLFLLVLTMISGARELMTPGAWERDGQTYRLRQATKSEDDIVRAERRQRLVDLTAFVRQWRSDNGRFPNDLDEAGVPKELQSPPGHPHTPYRYRGQWSNDAVGAVDKDSADDRQPRLLAEPNVFTDAPLMVTADGTVFVALPGGGKNE